MSIMEPESDQCSLIQVKPEPLDVVIEDGDTVKKETCAEDLKSSTCASTCIDSPVWVKTEPEDSPLQPTNHLDCNPSALGCFSVSLLKSKLTARLKSIVGSPKPFSNTLSRNEVEDQDQSANSFVPGFEECSVDMSPTKFQSNRKENLHEQDLIALSVEKNRLSNHLNGFIGSSHKSDDLTELSPSVTASAILSDSGTASTPTPESCSESYLLSGPNINSVNQERGKSACSSEAEFIISGNASSSSVKLLECAVDPVREVSEQLNPLLVFGLTPSKDPISRDPSQDKIKNELHDDFEEENLQDAATLQNTMNTVCIKTEPFHSEELFNEADGDSTVCDGSIDDDVSLLDESVYEESLYSEEGNRGSFSAGSFFGPCGSSKTESLQSDSVLSGSNTGSVNERGDDTVTEAQKMANIDKNRPSTGPLMKECRWSYTGKSKYKSDKIIIMDTSSISIEKRSYSQQVKRKYPNTCYICSEILPTKEALREHRKSHRGKGAYPCELCGKNFHSKGSRNFHMKSHQNRNCYQCDQCDKFYISHQAFKYHQLIHEKGGNFKCDECGRCFFFRSSWVSHQRAHAGENNHECQKCGKCFVHERSLSNHMVAHERPKVVACEYCGKRVRESGLKRHKDRRHQKKPRKCEICTKIYSDTQKFQLHVRSHDDENLFNCPCCDKRYVQRDRWRYHVSYHHGLKLSSSNDTEFTSCERREGKSKSVVSKTEVDTPLPRPERIRRSCRSSQFSYCEN